MGFSMKEAASYDPLSVCVLEPFMGGSHLAVARGWQRTSSHSVTIEGLPARFWKWRMRGAAFEFARKVRSGELTADIWFAVGLMDLAHFRALVPPGVPAVLYMHECQAAYPWPGGEGPGERDLQFLITDLASAAAADWVAFNSEYLRRGFFEETVRFLRRMPDSRPLWLLEEIEGKSSVVPIGVELADIGQLEREDRWRSRASASGSASQKARPTLLWCHRWEYDKNPEEFFSVAFSLADRGVEFDLIVAGKEYGSAPPVFAEARERLSERIVHWGGVEDRAKYLELLARSDVVVSCALHETFGISMIEAAFAGAHPLAPKRLSYPEIFPKELHADCLYGDPDELERKLEGLLTGAEELVEPFRLREAFGRYRWSSMIGGFDRLVDVVSERGAM